MLTLHEIREIAAPIAKSYGIPALYLFGSYARGNADSRSDLDFRFDRPTGMSLFAMGGLQYQLSEAFGLPVDVVATAQLNENFLHAIQEYEVEIYAE